MSEQIKIKLSKKSQEEVLSRVARYRELISKIKKDYSSRDLCPKLEIFGEEDKAQQDLFSWGTVEVRLKGIKELNRRLNTLTLLDSDLENIVSLSTVVQQLGGIPE